MDEDLLTIGAFSRATLLSPKALRGYHESGLLVPAVVDARTGYRGYTPGPAVRRRRDPGAARARRAAAGDRTEIGWLLRRPGRTES
ncbi:MerR family transcriptional regulator [Pseudonocardia sp. D17]|uniref:MerR family transcriptional regulator n=1 Tax=Pseudonocardia sp. D17 TaxID=882661 RepID=UPI002B3F09F8|nr:hypothetical protein PSD17_18080 [Pseudonocardia sp. D17]